MIYYTYLIDEKYIKSGALEWKMTGNGKIVTGTKKGKKYFIKKTDKIKFPKRSDCSSEYTYERYKEKALKVEKKQKEIAKRFKGLDVDTDRIVVEEENFWDKDDNSFVTITRFIDNALPLDYNFSSFPIDTRKKLFIQMAKLIEEMHNRKVIHGDLKENNFLFVEKGGQYYVYVIDFDASYPEEQIPDVDNIPLTPQYESPEVAEYFESEDDALAHLITNKTDIFTLGVIFNKMWTGKFPSSRELKGSIAEALLRGDSIIFDRSLDVFIGDINKATYISLLNWMLVKESEKRPTASQVYSILNDQMRVPDQYVIGKDVKPFTGLWDYHKDIFNFNEDELKSKGVKSFQKVIDSGEMKYKIDVNGTEEIYSTEKIIQKGLLTPKNIDLDDVWPEDNIQFVPIATFNEKGYASIKKSAIKKKYTLRTNSGISFNQDASWLIKNGLAILKEPEIKNSLDFQEPWPEHRGRWADDSVFIKRNVKRIVQKTDSGQHKYLITYGDGKQQLIDHVTLKMAKYMLDK